MTSSVKVVVTLRVTSPRNVSRSLNHLHAAFANLPAQLKKCDFTIMVEIDRVNLSLTIPGDNDPT